jgi:hypothetical protein
MSMTMSLLHAIVGDGDAYLQTYISHMHCHESGHQYLNYNEIWKKKFYVSLDGVRPLADNSRISIKLSRGRM